MVQVLTKVWALLLGIVLIMLGNGMHFTLIGLRGGIEGFSSAELAIITSGYYVGFLSGARFTPLLIRRVGHVRVFAALGSFMSAGLISFPLMTDPWAWTLIRVLLGFCMSGIYVAAESWLNDAATNDTRGKVLSAYMMAQTLGIIGAQGLLMLGDAGTSVLFIGASILVSVSFAPILLSAAVVPAVEVSKPMSLWALLKISPLGTVGIFLLGCVYATQSGMGAVFGSQVGLSANSTLVDAFSNANSGGFDPAYEGSKDRLSNFRNYEHVSLPFLMGVADATDSGEGFINVTWTAATGGVVDYYVVEQAIVFDPQPNDFSYIGQTSNLYFNTSILPIGFYYYRVKAVDTQGVSSNWSNITEEVFIF